MGCCAPNEKVSERSPAENLIRSIINDFRIRELSFEVFTNKVKLLINSNFDINLFDKIVLENFISNSEMNQYKDYQLLLIDDFNTSLNAITNLYAWSFSLIKKTKQIEFYLLKIIKIYKSQLNEASEIICFKTFLFNYLTYNIVFFTERVRMMIISLEDNEYLKLSIDGLIESNYNSKLVKRLVLDIVSQLEEIIRKDSNTDLLLNNSTIEEKHLIQLNMYYSFLWDALVLREKISNGL